VAVRPEPPWGERGVTAALAYRTTANSAHPHALAPRSAGGRLLRSKHLNCGMALPSGTPGCAAAGRYVGILSARPIFSTAAAESPPPITVMAPRLWPPQSPWLRPRCRLRSRPTRTRPWDRSTHVPALPMMSLKAATVLGPMSIPISPSGMAAPGTTVGCRRSCLEVEIGRCAVIRGQHDLAACLSQHFFISSTCLPRPGSCPRPRRALSAGCTPWPRR